MFTSWLPEVKTLRSATMFTIQTQAIIPVLAEERQHGLQHDVAITVLQHVHYYFSAKRVAASSGLI